MKRGYIIIICLLLFQVTITASPESNHEFTVSTYVSTSLVSHIPAFSSYTGGCALGYRGAIGEHSRVYSTLILSLFFPGVSLGYGYEIRINDHWGIEPLVNIEGMFDFKLYSGTYADIVLSANAGGTLSYYVSDTFRLYLQSLYYYRDYRTEPFNELWGVDTMLGVSFRL